MGKFITSLDKDLLEQFKGQPKILALIEVIGAELEAVYQFLEDLNVKRDVYTAEGVQLDGVGNIAGISRQEAAILAGVAVYDMTDDLYRKYIIYKILRNTCDCTYSSLMQAIRMFWNGSSPVRYSEDPEYPATIILDIEGFSETGSLYDLMTVPLIRAAGVGLRIMTTSKMDNGIYIAVIHNSEIESEWTAESYEIGTFYVDQDGNVLTTQNGDILIA